MTLFMKAVLEISTDFSEKPIIIEKITPYLNTSETVIASISQFFPHSHIIHLVRDGGDVLTSGVFHWLRKTQDHVKMDEIANLRRSYFVHKEKSVRLKRFFSDNDIEEWCLTWSQPIQSTRKFRRKQPVLQISYEEMIQDINATLGKIFRFIDVDTSYNVVQNCIVSSSFEKMSEGRKRGNSSPTAHVRKGITGDWKNYFTRQDGELFHRLAGKYLIDLGYEHDTSWIRSLPEDLSIGV
jgi:hypothetical protein